MIALPVLAVTAADVVIQTPATSPAPSRSTAGSAPPTPWSPCRTAIGRRGAAPRPRRRRLGRDASDGHSPAPSAERSDALGGRPADRGAARQVGVRRSTKGVAAVERRPRWTCSDPLTQRPVRPDVRAAAARRRTRSWSTQALTDKGYAVGDALELPATRPATRRSSGIAESTASRTYPVAAGPLGSLGRRRRGSQHVAGRRRPGLWATVRRSTRGRARALARGDPRPAAVRAAAEVRQYSCGRRRDARGASP